MALSILGLEKADSNGHSTPSSPSSPSSPSNGGSVIDRLDSPLALDDVEKALTPQISHSSGRLPVSREGSKGLSRVGTRGTTDPDFEVDWEEDDRENPRNWSVWHKSVIIGFISWSTWVVVIYSTSYTSGLTPLQEEFHIASEPVVTLGVTTYLLGLACGSVILAPVSEIYGRKPVYMVSMFLFMVLVIPCALATSLEEILIVRFCAALVGSAMISNAPGTIADVVSDEYRALAFSFWSIGPLNGPVFGPTIGGFVTQYLGWRWMNWIVMMTAAVAWIFLCILKETYSPALLIQKAAKRRAETGDSRWWCRYEQRVPFWELLRVNLSRPFVMAFTEPICIFWNVYIAIIYGILYLCFVAYPLIFTGIRGWSNGITGLSFLGIGAGVMLVIICEPLIRRLINSHKLDPETGKVYPEAMVSIVCISAVLIPIGEIWFAWTCRPPLHWIWSILAGIPFGAGNGAVFIYASNYLANSYGIYGASAMASNAVIRSIMGGTLPLAGPAMYSALGPHWAGTLLGLVQIAIIPIPLVFYRYGGRIRMRSSLISRMQADNQRLDGKREARDQRLRDEERAEAVVAAAGMAGVEERELDLEFQRGGKELRL